MITNLVQIGNSQGIRIPKKIIEQFDLKKMSLEILKDGIFIRPVKESDISHWDTPALRAKAKKQSVKINEFNAIDTDDRDWVW